MKLKTKILGLSLAIASLAALAFAPPGVTFSKEAHLYPSLSRTTATSSSALVDAGSGVFQDTTALTIGTAANGLHVFKVSETTGLELHFQLSGALGTTGTARVYRAIPVTGAVNTEQPVVSWTFRHLCDVSLTASAQSRNIGGIISADVRWASVSVTSDAGLAPLGCRTLNGTTANAAGSLFIDPLCASHIVVQTKIGTASDITVYASDWTRN